MGRTRAWDTDAQTAAGLAWAALALLIWAGWFGVTRAGVRGTIGPYDVAALRVGVGALVLLPAFLRSLSGRRLPGRAWGEAVILSLCWGAPFVLLVGVGIKLTSAGHAAGMTPSTMPLFAALILWAVRREHVRARRLAGFAAILVGVVVLTWAMPGADSMAGNAALLTGAAIWAVYTLRVGRSGLTPVQAATLTCLYSAIVYLPIYILCGLSGLAQASWKELAFQAVYQGVLSGAVSILAFNRAVALLGPAAAAGITSLVPVAAALLAVPLVGEIPGPFELVGLIVITLGVWFAARR